MVFAAAQLVQRALGVSESQLSDVTKVPQSQLRSADMPTLKAGAQMAVDAYFTDGKCMAVLTLNQRLLLGLAYDALSMPENRDDFYHTGLQFCFVAYHAVPGLEDTCRSALDRLLQLDVNSIQKVRQGRASSRRNVARLLMLRSHDKISRLYDFKGSSVDLSLAIELMPEGGENYRDMRAPLLLSKSDLSGARADLERSVAMEHADARHMHCNLFALAAPCN